MVPQRRDQLPKRTAAAASASECCKCRCTWGGAPALAALEALSLLGPDLVRERWLVSLRKLAVNRPAADWVAPSKSCNAAPPQAQSGPVWI